MNLVVIKSIVWVGLSFGWEAPFVEECGPSVFNAKSRLPIGHDYDDIFVIPKRYVVTETLYCIRGWL